MLNQKHEFIIITPIYEDVVASKKLFETLSKIYGKSFFIVAVDDGSVSYPIEHNQMKDTKVDGVILRLRRNVGHQKAISIGLRYISGHCFSHQKIVVMDSDGEDLPANISLLLKKLQSDDVDIVVAKRGSRYETIYFKIFYWLYKKFFSMMTGRSIAFGNFTAMKHKSLVRLTSMQELNVHFAGAVLASKLRLDFLSLDRGQRYAGQSKMNFSGLVLHGFRAFMVFAEDVLVRVGIACATLGFFTLLGIFLAIFLKLIGLSSPGWFSIVLGVLVLIFIQTGTLVLMMLMLTGIIKSTSVILTNSYSDYIEEIIYYPEKFK